MAALAAAALSGCASPGMEETRWKFVGQSLLGIAQKRPPAPNAQLTRAAVERSERPLMRIGLETFDASAIMVRISTNAGTETFATADGITVTMRDRVVIATRGLPPDLMAARVPTRAELARGGGTTVRMLEHLDGTDQPVRMNLTCTLAAAGSETITVAERAVAARVVTERCSGAPVPVENRYWFDGRGEIRQSLQWVGTHVGFLRLSHP
jgi:hypothetical protein